MVALTAVGVVVVSQIVPSKRRAVYWGITDQLDQMNGAVEVGENLRYAFRLGGGRSVADRVQDHGTQCTEGGGIDNERTFVISEEGWRGGTMGEFNLERACSPSRVT
jgi:hypothetical protein